MKTLTFVELPIYNGKWGVLSLINMNEVTIITPEKNWTRIFLKNNTDFLVTESYDKTMDLIDEQVNIDIETSTYI